jgi:hypothetical protein
MWRGGKTEQACRRGDMLEKRRELMEAWAILQQADDGGRGDAVARGHLNRMPLRAVI